MIEEETEKYSFRLFFLFVFVPQYLEDRHQNALDYTMITERLLRKLLRALLPIISIALTGCHFVAPLHHPPQSRENGKGAVIRFSYPDKGAVSVCVTGDFNEWSKTADCLSQRKGAFILEKRLTTGRYKYQLVIDSKTMVHDPGADLSEDDGFGGKNSVLVVE